MKAVKTRFCPSPTGLIHLGNARTALLSALLAKSQSGVFLLRIEDTDRERSTPAFATAMQRDLQWLGLNWQEGPDQDRGHGPYYQSERQSLYDDYYHRLEKADQAYPCFCSEEELKLSRKIQRASGKPPRYAGTCAALSEEAIKEKCDAGLKPTLRFRVPADETIVFHDLVRGEQRFNTNDIGDFIIRRANGTSPFMYCNALDDALMEVGYVVRGEDHLTNTPRQLMLLAALGLPAPSYAHISLITNKDGSPLSKREGSRSIQALREDGYLSQAVVNYLARLGHYFGHDHFMSLDGLAGDFKTTALSKSPAKFDAHQLDHWQKEAVSHLNEAAFWDWVGDDITKQVPESLRLLFVETVQPNVKFPKDVLHWATICFSGVVWDDAGRTLLQTVGQDYFKAALDALEKVGPDAGKITQYIKERVGVKGKALYQPLRVALTGESHGPELDKLLRLISPEDIQERFQKAQQ